MPLAFVFKTTQIHIPTFLAMSQAEDSYLLLPPVFAKLLASATASSLYALQVSCQFKFSSKKCLLRWFARYYKSPNRCTLSSRKKEVSPAQSSFCKPTSHFVPSTLFPPVYKVFIILSLKFILNLAYYQSCLFLKSRPIFTHTYHQSLYLPANPQKSPFLFSSLVMPLLAYSSS